jgi:hypothetical protein
MIKENQAIGKPSEDLKTAYNPDKNVGVGGGIYVYRTGQLDLRIANEDKETNSGELGVFSNLANFAADDVYCSPASTSVIGLPPVDKMVLKDYQNHMIGKAEAWYEDFPDGDTEYDEREISTVSSEETITTSSEETTAAVVRYRTAEAEQKKYPNSKKKYIVNEEQTVKGYMCLTLGYFYTRVNLTVKKTVEGNINEGEEFDFTVTVSGAIAEAEQELYSEQKERIFSGNGYTVIEDGKNNTDNIAKATFSLKAGEFVVLEGIPANATITIEEGSGEYKTAYIWSEDENAEKTYTIDRSYSIDNMGDQYSTLTCYNKYYSGTETEITLYAHEPFTTTDTSKPQSATVDLNEFVFESSKINEEYLSTEKTFNLYKADILNANGTSPGSWTLADVSSVEKNKRTAGSDYANSTFGITISVGKEESNNYFDVTNDAKDITMGEQETKLTFTIHNANAITQNTTAGILKLQLEMNNGVIITVNIKINRYPAQINATVPMYVCMYGYGGDGKVVAPSPDAYSIVNNSNCPIQITSLQGSNSNWNLKESPENLKAGEIFLSLANQVVTTEAKSLIGNSQWRILAPEKFGDSGVKLSIPIQAQIAGGSVNEDGEFKVCTVTYTAGIPEY